jgi:hypothetical protein
MQRAIIRRYITKNYPNLAQLRLDQHHFWMPLDGLRKHFSPSLASAISNSQFD